MKKHQFNILAGTLDIPASSVNVFDTTGLFIQGRLIPDLIRHPRHFNPDGILVDTECPSALITKMQECLAKGECEVIEVDSIPKHLREDEDVSLVAEDIARMERRKRLLEKTKMAATMQPRSELSAAVSEISQDGEFAMRALQGADGSLNVISFDFVSKP